MDASFAYAQGELDNFFRLSGEFCVSVAPCHPCRCPRCSSPWTPLVKTLNNKDGGVKNTRAERQL